MLMAVFVAFVKEILYGSVRLQDLSNEGDQTGHVRASVEPMYEPLETSRISPRIESSREAIRAMVHRPEDAIHAVQDFSHPPVRQRRRDQTGDLQILRPVEAPDEFQRIWGQVRRVVRRIERVEVGLQDAHVHHLRSCCSDL